MSSADTAAPDVVAPTVPDDRVFGLKLSPLTRRRLRNLYALDDHILQDIGMTRTALRSEAEKPFRR